MFSVFNSPCVFEQLPTFNQPISSHHFEYNSPVSYYPECKKRRAVKANSTSSERRGRNRSETLKYALAETPNGYTLSLYKRIPHELFSKYINENLNELKDNHYRPTYHVVRDFFGNQYYVEDKVNEDVLLRSALEDLDLKAIGKKIAKDLFQDYEMELNHRGDELSILSKKDNVYKNFSLDQVFDDVFVIGCGLENMDDDYRDKYALLKIGLAKHEGENMSSNAQQPKVLQNISAEEQSQGETKASPSYAEEEEGEDDAVETQSFKEEQIKKWIEEERLMQEENRKAEQEKLVKQRKEKEKKEKQAKLKAKKESLIRKQKAKRAHQKKKQGSSPSTTLKIEVGYKDNNSNTDVAGSDNESTNSESDMNSCSFLSDNTLRRHVSPILEDVEDEELDRYNESLSRSPRGNSIIEDM
ncbi:btn2p [Saccharomyces arboricola H-6]|uniref:Btn2p n=1 Tax=Saccharomyces arboricola (strain H-6 / AS 2.3317 / CBS 10644) TaxID=1160507 RepID=J8LNH0_SACAR|nr:btn2p [Saccharomyces arboricola H-6]